MKRAECLWSPHCLSPSVSSPASFPSRESVILNIVLIRPLIFIIAVVTHISLDNMLLSLVFGEFYINGIKQFVFFHFSSPLPQLDALWFIHVDIGNFSSLFSLLHEYIIICPFFCHWVIFVIVVFLPLEIIPLRALLYVLSLVVLKFFQYKGEKH